MWQLILCFVNKPVRGKTIFWNFYVTYGSDLSRSEPGNILG